MKNDKTEKELMISYLLFAVSIAVPVVAFIGAIVVMMRKPKNGGALASHYTWLRNTFLIGLGGGALASLLATSEPFLGIVAMMIVFIWYASRIIKGMFYFLDGRGLKGDDLNFGVDDARQDMGEKKAA